MKRAPAYVVGTATEHGRTVPAVRFRDGRTERQDLVSHAWEPAAAPVAATFLPAPEEPR